MTRGEAPLLVSVPHAGTDVPDEYHPRLRSLWLARKDADWWVDRLYGFATTLGATMVRTSISRTVIDVNRDPSGLSLYPGQATTELCPMTTFDGEPLWHDGVGPDAVEIGTRRERFFDPYHAALGAELARLRQRHRVVVLYDCHSIRSRVPRLFDGELPHFNIGTNDGTSAAAALADRVDAACTVPGFTRICNGRFKGGYITRHYGQPRDGVHAIQMELACRGYMDEPSGSVDEHSWPSDFDPARADPLRVVLETVLRACLDVAPELPGSEKISG